jgi:hypothetical protein
MPVLPQPLVDSVQASELGIVKVKPTCCKCNIYGDRPMRPLYERMGRTFCARCEKPVNLCPLCGALCEPGAESPCACENGGVQLDSDTGPR